MIDTRKIAKEYRMAHWLKIMQERQDSGKSIKDYCKINSIPINVYHYWQRKLREEAVILPPANKEPKTVSAQSASNQNQPTSWAICERIKTQQNQVEIKIGKSRILVYPETDLKLLTKVCQALMALC